MCYCEGVRRRTAYHLSMKKERGGRRRESERERERVRELRQGYRRRQMERGK